MNNTATTTTSRIVVRREVNGSLLTETLLEIGERYAGATSATM
jgi:hypothetical protein